MTFCVYIVYFPCVYYYYFVDCISIKVIFLFPWIYFCVLCVNLEIFSYRDIKKKATPCGCHASNLASKNKIQRSLVWVNKWEVCQHPPPPLSDLFILTGSLCSDDQNYPKVRCSLVFCCGFWLCMFWKLACFIYKQYTQQKCGKT